MTLFLASVRSAAEAEAALAGGADLIDLKEPDKGTLGALALEDARSAVAVVARRRPTSLVLGDLPMDPHILATAVERGAETGVEYVKVGLFDDVRRDACIAGLAHLRQKTRLIGVLFADQAIDLGLVDRLAAAGFAGALLDTARKDGGPLLALRDSAWLSAFVGKCHERGLLAGLAGSLEPPDVPRLLPLQPDILGFRGALCRAGDRRSGLDPEAVSLLRELIPRESRGDAARGDGFDRVDYRLLVGRGYAVEPRDGASRTDRVLVRDLVLPASIGAYRNEHVAPQRVRFNVDAFVQRGTHAPANMRDVLSYDVITDAIGRILAEGHVELVEALAERIASGVLGQPRVVKVVVRVEKLDVGPAAVGVEITRERTAEAVILKHQPPSSSGDAGS